MKKLSNQTHSVTIIVLSSIMLALATPGSIIGHCDSEDGPILPEARHALETGDLSPLLKWVTTNDETQIRDLFDEVRKLRDTNEEVRHLADQYFLETFIRLHRQSEGAPYSGIKPAGMMPAIFKSADSALKVGDVHQLADKISATVRKEIMSRFNSALEKKQHMDESVEAGREYVEVYVTYMHFLEGLHSYLQHGAVEHHFGEVNNEEH